MKNHADDVDDVDDVDDDLQHEGHDHVPVVAARRVGDVKNHADDVEEEARCTVHRGEPGETNEGRAREERRQSDIISFLPFSDTIFNRG